MSILPSSKSHEVPRVVLVNPPALPYWYKTESLGIAYLASFLRSRAIPVKLVDANVFNLNIAETLKKISETPFVSVVGFTVGSFDALTSALKIASSLKNLLPKIHVCLGGHFATFWYEEILEKFNSVVDSIILSEGESSFLELVQNMHDDRNWRQVEGMAYYEGGKVVYNEGRWLLKDLDALPFPARDHALEMIRQGFPVVISGSRGCIYNCSFCQIHRFYKKHEGAVYRQRSPENIVAELELLKHEYDAGAFFFVDDNFIIGDKGKQWAYEIGQGIIRRRLKINIIMQCVPSGVDKDLFRVLKKAGLFLVYLGFESPLAKSLSILKKPIRLEHSLQAVNILTSLDININPGIILYDTETSLEDLKDALRALKGVPAMAPFDIHGLSILKGTDLEEQLEKKGRLIRRDFHLDYFVYDPRVELVRRLLADYREQMAYHNLLFLLYKNLLSLSQEGPSYRKKVVRETLRRVSTLNLQFLENVVTMIESGSFADLSSLFAKVVEELEEVSNKLKKEVEPEIKEANHWQVE